MADGGNGINDALYRTIVEESPDGIWVFDLEGRTIYANDALAELYGVEPGDVGSLTVFDTLDEPGRVQFHSHLVALREGRFNPHDVECQWVRHDGSTRWVLVRESAVRAEDGTLIGVLHRVSDYSHRRATLTALTQARADLADKVSQYDLLQGIASAANDAHSLVQVLGRGRELLLLMPDWERAVAFLVEGDRLTRLHPVPDQRDAEIADDETHPERAARELEVAARAARSGTKEWDDRRVSVAFPIRHLGRVHAVGVMTATPPLERFELIERMLDHVVQQLEHVLAREIAELSLAEARDAAMMASQQKSDFLATVSHEIRTPLNGVLGLNDLLLRTGLDAEQRRLADGIRTSGQLLLSLINDILDFSKIEAGRVVLEQIDFDLRAVLDQVAAPIVGVATAKGLQLEVAYDAGVPAVLCGDPTKLSQVFANLLTNAVKFTDVGSVRASVRVHPLADRWRLTVRVDDTGVGIDSSTTDVFAPFQQADSSTTRIFGGTGLGLAISRELAQAMGGDIGYTSTAGCGSSFWFTGVFGPATGAEPVTLAEPVRPESSAVVAPLRVLVVEDNRVNQLVATGMLTALGHTADTAEDGVAALEVLEREAYDLVLMDVQMPRMDGYEATRQIRAREGDGERTLVIAMTANVVAGERERCLAAGMDDFLTKPVDLEQLTRTLARWFAGEGALDLTRLDLLRDMDPSDTSYLERVTGRFEESSLAVADDLRCAVETDDADALRAHAHKLAGGAANLGAVEVAALARELEALGDAGTTSGAGAVLVRLVAALERARTGLRAYRERWWGPAS
ncbi:response regulator [Nocardioides sp. P5_C9_2]